VALGIVLLLGAVALYFGQDAVIRRVTSQSLGSLAPGYAATKPGYRSYVSLVAVVGLIAIGIGTGNVWLIIASIVLFLLGSLLVIFGEVVVYRRLKR